MVRSLGHLRVAPRAGHSPPDAAWQAFEMFRDVLPRQRDGE